MKLSDLRPGWFAAEGRHGQGIIFDCPCGCRGTERAVRLAVLFQPTLDGGEPLPANKIGEQYRAIHHTLSDEPDPQRNVAPSGIVWQRTGGDTFESLSLWPSIDYGRCGHWHGHVKNGEIQ